MNREDINNLPYSDANRILSREGVQESEKALELRRLYRQKLVTGGITFHQFMELSKEPSLKTLRTVRVINLLSSFAGWTKTSARYAFVANNLPENLRVKDCYNPPRSIIVSMLMDSSSSTWQRRRKAPDGWPWHGNIAVALADLEQGDLPHEIREVRWRFASEIESSSPEKELTAKQKSQQITDILGGRTQDVSDDHTDDGLDDLLEDGLDDIDDGLDDLLDEGDQITSDDINDFLGL